MFQYALKVEGIPFQFVFSLKRGCSDESLPRFILKIHKEYGLK